MSTARRARRADKNKSIAKKSLSTMSTHELQMLQTNSAVKQYDRLKDIKRLAIWILAAAIAADILLSAIFLMQ